MYARIKKAEHKLSGSISLPASKSIANRLLMIRALSGQDFVIENLSEAADTVLLQQLLKEIEGQMPGGNAQQNLVLDCGNAGTVFRFLLPYLANRPGSWLLTGSDRMKQRPVAPLVDGLRQLGAEIQYLEKQGFPPLQITGKTLTGGQVSIDASDSSQYATALMLMGSFLPGGIKIELSGEIVSQPYLRMTAKLLQHFGIKTSFLANNIHIQEQEFQVSDSFVEPDWSSSSYWFEAVCLSGEAEILLKNIKFSGLQGDEAVAGIFYRLGVICEEVPEGLLLRKGNPGIEDFNFDFRHNPDLAMAVAVSIAGMGIQGNLSGLKNLAIKESHRLQALQAELVKLGCTVVCTADELSISAGQLRTFTDSIQTYSDHRMAMAFASLAAVSGEILIDNPEVVEKSYPGFWQDMMLAGFGVDFTAESCLTE